MVILISSVVPTSLFAAFNEQINYQGKLTNSVGAPVSNGTYNMEFKLYANNSTTTALWTETLTGSDKVTVTNGLFSIMLGSTTPFTGVDFDQTLYLGVNIGGTSTPSWDGEMSPRKVLGAVPAAMVAKNAKLFDGNSIGSFVRLGVDNATNTSSTALKVTQNGSGNIVEFVATSSSPALVVTGGGLVGVGTSTPSGSFVVQGQGSTNPFIVASSTGTQMLTLLNNGNFGIGSSTPMSTLSVKGRGGVNPFTVSSSSDAVLFTVNQFGSTTIASLASGGCDVLSDSSGNLYCGTNGGGSGNSAFTIGNGFIYNATSSDFIGIGTTTPGARLDIWGDLRVATGSVPLFYASTSLNRIAIGTTSLNSLLNVGGTTTTQVLTAGKYSDGNKSASLVELYRERYYSKFTQYNPMVATTTPHVPTNYYLATSTTALTSLPTDTSGVTYYPGNNSIMFNRNTNGSQGINEFTPDGGKLLRTITLAGFSDPEALGWMYDDWFVIGEENTVGTSTGARLVIAQIPDGATTINRNNFTQIDLSSVITVDNTSIEGVSYDPDRDVFYVAEEQGVGLTGQDANVFQVTRSGVITTIWNPSTAVMSALNFGDFSDLYYDRNTQHIFLAVDQCYNQANGGVGCDQIIEIDLNGNVIDRITAPNGFNQVEGIGFSPDGENMYISGEASMFAWYKFQNTSDKFFAYQSSSSTASSYGIGTTTPSATFTVQGRGGINPFIVASSTGTNLLTLLQNGNFGIGSSTPGALLAVQASASTASTTPLFDVASSSGTSILRVINNSVGIGSSSPAAKLSILGDSSATTASAPFVIAAYGGSGGSSNGVGGGYLFQGGTGGSSGNGGAFTVVAGAGGATGGGGAISLTAGNSGSGGTTNAGGAISLTAGAGSGNGAPSGAGGAVTITTGVGGSGSGTGGAGGLLSLVAGNGGSGSTPGVGGAVAITGGTAGSASSVAVAGGAVTITGGTGGIVSSGTPGAGGVVALLGGSAGTGGTGGAAGGNVFIAGGLGRNATGTVGDVVLGMSDASTQRGNVGVGSSTPIARLSVVGSTSLSEILTVASSTNARLFTVYSAGQVSIGTTTVTSKLNVDGSVFVGSGAYSATLADSANTRAGYFVNTTDNHVAIFGNRGGAAQFNASSQTIYIGTTTSAINVTTNGIPGAFFNNSTATAILATSTFAGIFTGGNVGIGTTSPVATLAITGSGGNSPFLVASSTGSRMFEVNALGALLLNNDAGVSGYVLRSFGAGAPPQWVATSSLGISGGSGGSSQFTIGNGFIYNATTTDLFAIGTTTPLSKLSVYGDIFLEGSSRYINFGTATGTSGYGFRDNAGTLQFKNAAGSWSSFTSGTGTPSGVAGAIQFTDGSTFASDASNFFWNNTLKRLGIGTSTPGTALTVVGTTTSDYLVVGGGTPLANSIAHFGADTNSFAQVNVQNRNAGTSASSDFVATSDNGNDTKYYIDLGINSSGYNNPAYSITGANDGYLYTSDGSLAIGTASTTNTNAALKFHTGGTLAANERMRITSAGNVGIGTATPAEKLHVAGNILIGAQTDSAPTWTKRSDATAGTIDSGGTSAIGSTTAMAVFNGSLYAGTTKANSAEVYRYNGGTDWTLVSSTTPGAFGTSTTVNINGVASMAVWNGNLYIGTAEPAAAEVYRYNGNSSWTKVSSSTAGAIGGNSTTTAINEISSMTVHGGYLYIGTAKTADSEVARYNGPLPVVGHQWTKVNALANAKTFGTETTGVNDVSALVSFQGYLYAFTSRANDAGMHRYDGQNTTGTGWTSIITTGAFSGNGPAGATTLANIDEVTAAAVYGGRLYFSLYDTANGSARVVKWDGNLTAGAIFQLVSSTTAGVIAEDSGSQTGIDRVSSMAVYNDDLFIGTADTTGIGQVYKIDQGLTWSLVSSTTAGTISTGAGATTGISGVTSLQVYNNNLWVGTEKASAAEVYSFNVAEAESYDLMFHAIADEADAEQNGFLNTAFIEFQAEESAYNNAGNQNTGKFNFSHGLNTITGAYDLAEDYPTHDDMLGVADLVTLDTRDKGLVKRSTGKGDRNVIGIYSENPALRLSQKDAFIDGARAVPIALAGRVPVNVTIENGAIEIGDYLTASVEPGKAAKATTPGRVIGRALSPYNGEGEARVTVFIGMETIGWTEIQRAQTDVAALDNDQMETPDSFEAYVERINEGVSDIALALISKLENTTLLVANKVVALVLNVKEAFIATLTILPDGNIVLPSGQDQIAGVGSILGGFREVFVKNAQVDERSIISITPTSPTEVPLYVSEKRPGEGFVVQMSRVTPDTISFTWVIFKTYEKMGNVIASSTDSVSSTTETTVVNVNADTVTNTVINDPVSSSGEPVTSSGDTTVVNTEGHSSSTDSASSSGGEVPNSVADPVSSEGSGGQTTATSEGGANESGGGTPAAPVSSEPGQTVTPETPTTQTPEPAPIPEPAPAPDPAPAPSE